MATKKTKKLKSIDRDVSWMFFNHRILQEAQKETVPLLERLSFLGIYSNNLDEFFRVRMASLNRLLESDNKEIRKRHDDIRKTIKTINKLNATYSTEYADAINQVFKSLEQHNIRLLDEQHLNDEQKEYLKAFFYDKLNGYINPIWFSEVEEIAKLEDNRIYLLVKKTECGSGVKKPKSHLFIVKVPDRETGRFLKVPSSDGMDNIMYLDDVIRYCLPLTFIGFNESTFEAYSFKFTKDAEMEMDNASDYGVLQKIAKGVISRRKGDPVRLIYDRQMPRDMQRKLMEKMHLDRLDTALASSRYQNHKDLMSFPGSNHSDLKFPRWKPIMPTAFLSDESVLQQIRRKDLFIHVPYHSFDSYIRVLREAALQPEVKSIKTTLYRLAKDSKVVKALICAARNGKKVTAVVELLARFDEESNIKWSKRMQEEGIHVIYGVEGLKIHSKLLHIESSKGNIACIGTGNFHEGNAKVYTDYLMMTARKELVNEVSRVFDFIEKPFSQPHFKHLLVSPITMKTRILQLINTEIKNARLGREAWIKVKINHITEPDVVNKLYEAASEGVKIDLVVRGNCSLVTTQPALQGNIKGVGIIDRYLEHSRILIFCNGGSPRCYIGSADWMPRNLLNRIEVMTPVFDEDMQRDLKRTVEYGLADTTNGRIVDGSGSNCLQSMENQQPFRSQEQLYLAYKKEAEQQEKVAAENTASEPSNS